MANASFKGMDTGAVRAIAGQLKTASSNIQTLMSQVDTIVNNSQGQWHGSDQQQFVNDWTHTHRVNFRNAMNALLALSQKAMQNAAKQDETSAQY